MPSDWAMLHAELGGWSYPADPARQFSGTLVARQFLGIGRPPVVGMVARQLRRDGRSRSAHSGELSDSRQEPQC
jgi:hypothetical protein